MPRRAVGLPYRRGNSSSRWIKARRSRIWMVYQSRFCWKISVSAGSQMTNFLHTLSLFEVSLTLDSRRPHVAGLAVNQERSRAKRWWALLQSRASLPATSEPRATPLCHPALGVGPDSPPRDTEGRANHIGDRGEPEVWPRAAGRSAPCWHRGLGTATSRERERRGTPSR